MEIRALNTDEQPPIELLLLADPSPKLVGVGKQLVNHAIQNAKLLGFKTLEIGTGNSSNREVRL